MSNNYLFLSLQRVPILGGFEPAPSELSYVEEWIESQRDRLANFADEVVDAFAECHRAAATEMEVDYPFEYALEVCVRRSGINHIWHRAIFYGGRESPKQSTTTKLAKTVLPTSQTGSVWFTSWLSTALTLCTSTKLSC